MTARTRRRLSAASFGPEWAPPTPDSFGWWLVHHEAPRHRPRAAAHLRAARRRLAASEARWADRATVTR